MERIERHDLINAVGLAVVLMGIALLLILAARALFDTVGGGLVESTRPPAPATTEAPAEVTEAPADPAQTEADPAVGATTTLPPRPPSEVTIRVFNSAQRAGIAAAGGSRLSSAGYDVVDLKNGPPQDASVVYHAEGYENEARAVARALNIAETAVQPVPAQPPVDASGVAVVVLLGADTTVG